MGIANLDYKVNLKIITSTFFSLFLISYSKYTP